MIPRVLVGWHVNVRCKLHAHTEETLLPCYTILVLVLFCAYMFACTPEVLRSWSKETLFVFPKRCETVKTRGVFHKRVTVLNKPVRIEDINIYIYYIKIFFR